MCWAAVVLLTASSAVGAPSRVRIISADDADPVVVEAITRLRAELVTEGFEVVSDVAKAGDARAVVEANTDATVFASIALLRVGDSPVADVWVADHVTGKTLVRRVEAGVELASERTRSLAIRAVELLRASLLEVREPHPTPLPHPVPSDVTRWIAPVRPRALALDGWSTEVAVATTKNVGFGPTLAPCVRLTRSLGGGFIARVAWIGPTFGADITAKAGTVQAHQALLLAEAAYTLGTWRLAPVFAVGLGAADTFATGNAHAPFIGVSAQAFSLAVHASVGLHLRVTAHAGVLFETGAVTLAPERPIAIVGTNIANTAPLSWVSSLGLVTRFD